jgi:hypothetical protein
MYFYVFFWDLGERRVFHLRVDWEIQVAVVARPGIGGRSLNSGKGLFDHVRTGAGEMHEECIGDLVAVTEESIKINYALWIINLWNYVLRITNL